MIALTLLMTFSAVSASAQNKDRKKSFKSWDNYEITTEKVGVDGTKFVKVWGFGKNADAAVMAKADTGNNMLIMSTPAKMVRIRFILFVSFAMLIRCFNGIYFTLTYAGSLPIGRGRGVCR